ncbi:hypothetical protein [Prosthecobacter sp.]|uniref:hypothetical protein n=1 Tax=Prosthecobacter sp. TaxID=1965333 RepID=UPI001D4D109D|nr:hypothetical protein [Prosthecobacter sp.]MCB1276820.1 hypothetical protein [Prosthecobacter sp.]
MKTFRSLLPLVFLCGSVAAQENALTTKAAPTASKPATDGRVWGALVFATNDALKLNGGKEQIPAHLPRLNERLAKVFPFQHFEILGQHQQDIFREYESWVVPSRDLFMKIDSKGLAENGGINLHLQVWREQQVLVKSDAVLKKDSPLFIGGPAWKGGRLIFILSLEKTKG